MRLPAWNATDQEWNRDQAWEEEKYKGRDRERERERVQNNETENPAKKTES